MNNAILHSKPGLLTKMPDLKMHQMLYQPVYVCIIQAAVSEIVYAGIAVQACRVGVDVCSIQKVSSSYVCQLA